MKSMINTFVSILSATFAPILIVGFSLAPVLAADQSQVSQSEFVTANPDCREFNDQCSICKIEDGEILCSTPKPVCIKREYQCTRSVKK